MVIHPLLNCRRLPARLDAESAAVLLGFQPHDVPVLVAAELLKPLGKPMTRQAKWFAAVVIEECARDAKWLDKATRAISDNWKERNGRVNGVAVEEPVQVDYA